MSTQKLNVGVVSPEPSLQRRVILDLLETAFSRTHYIPSSSHLAHLSSTAIDLRGSMFGSFPEELMESIFSNCITHDPDVLLAHFAKFSLVSRFAMIFSSQLANLSSRIFYRSANSPAVWHAHWARHFPGVDSRLLDTGHSRDMWVLSARGKEITLTAHSRAFDCVLPGEGGCEGQKHVDSK